MDKRLENARKEEILCLVCEKSDAKTLGVRGNREYSGANPNIEPHLFTNVVQCRNCGFIYTNPEIKGVEFLEREHYNNPETYQNENSDNILEMFEHRVAYLKTFKSNGKLLDVGAGKGDFVFVAKKNGFDAVGVEPSPRFSEFAEKEFQVKVYQGFLAEQPELKNQKFDLITMHHVLEHIEKPKEILHQLPDFLSENGLIYIEVPNTDSYTVKLIDLYFRLRGRNWSSRLSPLHPPFHKYGYTPKSLRILLEQSGYKIEKEETFSIFSRSFYNKDSGNFLVKSVKSVAIKCLDALGNRDMLTFVVSKK
ncbi:MAG: class I SAM-dependent methyltransferase [Pyrinomonadaceae bacterium]|jgi:2-polyprenyl-3-methyl-5-hydroxy-6-metoxy-1,4-benzoquinol methylase|nr:class I SAM-dependent methyltransferase [Pyrinomonadaceae bacterium]